MKRLLLLLPARFLSAKLQAQSLKTDAKKPKVIAAYREAITQHLSQKKGETDTAGIIDPKAYLVIPKPGIHRLPQDIMPCIVPDLNATVAIPNVWAGKVEVPFKSKAPRTPNPAKTFKLSPSRPLIIHPKIDSDTR